MANGDLSDEVETLLAKKQISTPAALRLVIKMGQQTYKKVEAFEERVERAEKDIDDLKRVSVVKVWQRHPKLMWSLLVMFIVLSTYLDASVLVQRLVGMARIGP